jgi:hypothetical protein
MNRSEQPEYVRDARLLRDTTPAQSQIHDSACAIIARYAASRAIDRKDAMFIAAITGKRVH